jgi:glycosyltransferase involved in cell wall biosynthesis
MTFDVSQGRPWVAIVYSAIEPVARRGGGIHNAVIGQAVGLMANGVHTKIFTASEACAAEARERGIAVDLDQAWNSGIDPMFSKRIWWRACREAGRLPAAVIHNSGRTWLAGTALFPGILQAQVLHREVIYPYRCFRNWISLSEHYAQSLRASPSGWFRRIAVAPNGLLDDPPLPVFREKTGPVVFGTAGRLSKAKGIETLIEAAALIPRDEADIRFRIAGSGWEPFQELAGRRGVADLFEFIGWTDNMDGFLDSLDVFCLPSEKEAFGLVLIEAMARGLPVISTMTNGGRDIVQVDETGWLVPIADAGALAASLHKVASDRAEIARRGKAAYSDVMTRFTPSPAGRRLIEELASLGASLA